MDRGTWRATVHGVTKELDMTYLLNNSDSLYEKKTEVKGWQNAERNKQKY